MFNGSLAQTYALRFCKEHPNIKLSDRDGGPFREILGIGDIWPDELNRFSYSISKNHSHRKVNYGILKNVILLEKSELLTRDYISLFEYETTMKIIFESCIEGMKHGKLERVYHRRKKIRQSQRGIVGNIFEKSKEKIIREILNSKDLKKKS